MMRFHMIFAIFLVVAAGAGFAQTTEQKPAEETEEKKKFLFEWTDERGVVHITDELGKVPPEYRDKAGQSETSDAVKAAEGMQGQRNPAGTGHSDAQRQEEAEKARWQERMRDARQQLVNAERRYRELERRRKEALGYGGGPASGRREGIVEADRIEQEMKEVEREIGDARNRIEVVIPEEARKAGVPPGWLRE